MPAKPIPEGYHTISPSLTVDGAAEAIEFYKRAFAATERSRMTMPDGKIAHAELNIGDSVVMLNDSLPQASVQSPKHLGGTTTSVFLYVEDVDSVVQDAIDAGATVTMPVADQFWGDRFGAVSDPFGHHWAIATHVEDLTPKEIAERGREAMASMG
jgi:PhnB protein